jgi:hypothetical protein
VSISDRIHKREGEISDLHLGQFEPDGSQGDRFLRDIAFGVSLTRESLVSFAQLFYVISGIQFPRDYTRRRALVVKWFNDHLEELRPLGGIFTVRVDKLIQRKRLAARRAGDGQESSAEEEETGGE